MLITAILVTFNRKVILEKSLRMVLAQNLPLLKIVVVDNGSNDDTIEFVNSEVRKNEKIKLLSMSSNLGFGAGLAAGMKWAYENTDSEYFWLMDDDSFPAPETLELLMTEMEKYDVHILGHFGYKMNWFNKRTVKPSDYSTEVDFLLVDNALVKREAAEAIGFPSGDFFMMCEDYDYCLRAKKAGMKLGIIKSENVQRLNLGSEKFSRSTLWRGYYHSRNHLLILKRYPSLKRIINYIVIQLKYLSGSILAPDRFKRIKFRLIGISHGIKGIKGKTLDPATLKFS